jgi:hypothetical protein
VVPGSVVQRYTGCFRRQYDMRDYRRHVYGGGPGDRGVSAGTAEPGFTPFAMIPSWISLPFPCPLHGNGFRRANEPWRARPCRLTDVEKSDNVSRYKSADDIYVAQRSCSPVYPRSRQVGSHCHLTTRCRVVFSTLHVRAHHTTSPRSSHLERGTNILPVSDVNTPEIVITANNASCYDQTGNAPDSTWPIVY